IDSRLLRSHLAKEILAVLVLLFRVQEHVDASIAGSALHGGYCKPALEARIEHTLPAFLENSDLFWCHFVDIVYDCVVSSVVGVSVSTESKNFGISVMRGHWPISHVTLLDQALHTRL